jgi:hypothetical protein
MQPIDFLILAIYFLLEAFGHVAPTPMAYFFLALALLLGRLLTGGTISFVIVKKEAKTAG